MLPGTSLNFMANRWDRYRTMMVDVQVIVIVILGMQRNVIRQRWNIWPCLLTWPTFGSPPGSSSDITLIHDMADALG